MNAPTVPIRRAWLFKPGILHFELRLRRAEAEKVCRFFGMSQIDCRIDRTGFVDSESRSRQEAIERLRRGGAQVSLDLLQVGGAAEYEADVNGVALSPDSGDRSASINLDVSRIGQRKAAGFG